MMVGCAEVRLGDVAAFARDAVDPMALSGTASYIGLEHIPPGGGVPTPSRVQAGDLASSKFAFRSGDVLFGKLRPYLAKVARPHHSGICSTDILPIRPSAKLDRDFLYFYLLQPSVIARLSSLAQGANLPRLSPSALASLILPLPPLDEQRRIAAVLDQAQELRGLRTATTACLDRALESLTDELQRTAQRRDRGWSESSLGEVAEVQGGLQVTSARASNPREVPYLRVANVLRGRLDLSEVKSIKVTESEYSRTMLKLHDILVVEGHGNPGEIGRCALWNAAVPNCVHQNHLIRVRFPNSHASALFVSMYLNSVRGRRFLLGAGRTTSGLNTISVTDVKRVPVPIPPSSVLEFFVQRVAAIDRLKAAHSASLAKLDELFASLQFRAFRGEL